MNEIPPLMQTTPGFTEPELAELPIASEGEATVGPNDANPYRSLDEKETVESYRERLQRQQTDTPQLVQVPFNVTTKDDPTEDPDPFVFDDAGEEIGRLQLPTIGDGPQF